MSKTPIVDGGGSYTVSKGVAKQTRPHNQPLTEPKATSKGSTAANQEKK